MLESSNDTDINTSIERSGWQYNCLFKNGNLWTFNPAAICTLCLLRTTHWSMSGYLRIVSFENNPTSNYPLKRIEWYLMKALGIGYQMILIWNVISDIRWYWYEAWYRISDDTDIKCDITLISTLRTSDITELEWGVNTSVKTKQAGYSYGGFDTLLISTEEPVIYTEPKEVYLKDSDIKNRWYQPIEEGNYRNLLLKAIEGAYRRGQL